MTKPAPRAKNGEAGVALIEVLVAILLFSLGILGLIGLQARAISFSVDAEDRNRAALLANDAASTMWLKKNVVLDTTDLSAWQARVTDLTVSGLPNATGTIATVTGTTNAADITIKWKSPSRASTDDQSVLTTRVTLP